MITRVYFNGIYEDNDAGECTLKTVIADNGDTSLDNQVTKCPYGKYKNIVETSTGIYRLAYSPISFYASVWKLQESSGVDPYEWVNIGGQIPDPGFDMGEEGDGYYSVSMDIASTIMGTYLLITGEVLEEGAIWNRPSFVVYKLVNENWALWCTSPGSIALGYTYSDSTNCHIFITESGDVYIQSKKLVWNAEHSPPYYVTQNADAVLLKILESSIEEIFSTPTYTGVE